MDDRNLFQKKLYDILTDIGEDTLAYDESEFWMIRSQYEYLEYYAAEHQLLNTAVALPLARGIHNGSHRKATITRNGTSYRLPYVIHCLTVCRILADQQIALSLKEKDILLASALCHDMIEDVPFPEHGRELTTKFHLDPRVYDTVLLVSKRRDFTPEEEQEHFCRMAADPLSLLVKLSDRGNNVEDLYNRSCWKVHEYVGETRTYFLPMIDYGMAHFPHLQTTLSILSDKIHTLTEVAEILVNRYEQREQELEQYLDELKVENRRLRQEWLQLTLQ